MTSRSEGRPSRLAAAALSYASNGWPVFPLIPKDKRPLTSDGFKSATWDHDTILAWWEQWPEANIGLATGLTFDVLDIDGETGRHTLEVYLNSLGHTFKHTGPVAITGKGWHYYFASTGKGNRANMRGDAENKSNLDFRGLGGYVVAPPSLHPLGHRYTWDQARPPRLELPFAPDWLIQLLETPSEEPVPLREVPIPSSTTIPARFYFEQVEAGSVPRDHIPRGLRQRFERPDILEVATKLGLKLVKRSGGRYYHTNCLWHGKDSDPSLAIYPSNNTFYCYGCERHGDSWDLLNKTHIQ